MSKIYSTDVGTEIILDCGQDISTATSTKILYQDPSGVTGEWTGTVTENTKIKYTTLTPLISGKWKLQAQVTLPNPAWTGTGETVELIIHAPFE